MEYGYNMIKIYTEKELDELVNIIKNDGVISVPTDTVFGVCAIVNSASAFEKLKKVKNRPDDKAFPIMCSDINQIKSIAVVDDVSEKIIKAFMPGPITIILKKKAEALTYINNQGNEKRIDVAIRMAPTKILYDLITTLGSPIFMTSANQSGEEVCQTLDEIEQSCPLLDGMLEGNVNYGQASTIVDCTKDEIKIVREGPITLEDITKVLNEN